MTNIPAKIPGTNDPIVILAGHYDTKRMATAFVGANDGASSAAFLLEMARVLAQRHNKLTYWLVFFDGEEAVKSWSETDSLYGSRHFAEDLARQRRPQSRIKAVIVVDMIADAHLEIHRESHSTRWLTDVVFTQAQRLGYGRYFVDSPMTVEDDHMPFLELGIPAVDIIDLDYGPFNLYWHTGYDTVDRCNPTSLDIVGDVVRAALEVMESGISTKPRPLFLTPQNDLRFRADTHDLGCPDIFFRRGLQSGIPSGHRLASGGKARERNNAVRQRRRPYSPHL